MPALRTLSLTALAVAVPVAVLGASVVPADAVQAKAKAPTAQQVLRLVAHSGDAHYSGTVTQTSDLGLPQLPTTGAGSASSDSTGIVDLITAPHTAKVYVDGATKQRVQVLDQLAERDVIRNGSTVWLWDSKTDAATRVTLPSKTAATPRATATPATPAAVAKRLLSAVKSSSTVSVATGSTVAGRAVDRLVLTPRTDQTLVAKVVLSVDAATGVPLRIEVDARGQSDPAVSIGFTDVSFARPASSLFSFTPPSGAKVTTKDLSAAHRTHATPSGAPTAAPSGRARPTVSGSGWGSVVTLSSGKVPASLTSSPLYSELTTRVSDGRALQTSLVSVLITDDGRVLAGAVPLSTLEAAAK